MYRNVFGVAPVLVMYYVCIVVYSQCIRGASVSRRYRWYITYVLECICRRVGICGVLRVYCNVFGDAYIIHAWYIHDTCEYMYRIGGWREVILHNWYSSDTYKYMYRIGGWREAVIPALVKSRWHSIHTNTHWYTLNTQHSTCITLKRRVHAADTHRYT
jgi:hypothetical protein